MRFDLAAMASRVRTFRRRGVGLRVIEPPKIDEAALAAVYVQMLRQIAERIRQRLLPAYERALAEGVRDDVPELGLELDNLDPEVRRLVLTLTPELRRWVVKYEARHRSKWKAAAYTATGVDLTTLLGPEDVAETMDAVLARNVALIRNVGAEAQGRIADVVWRGYQKREPARLVARGIDEALQLGRKRSLRIAADQLQKLSSALDQERRRQAGIEHWIWRHSHKAHPRPEHVARDGNIYTDKTAPDDLPGELPFCGCKAQAWLGEVPKEQAQATGIVAKGEVQAHFAKQKWVGRSPIKSAAEAHAAATVNQGALGKVGSEIQASLGAQFADPGPKSLSGIERKINAGRAPAAVTDAVRGGFSVSSPEQADRIVRALAKKFDVIDEDWAVTPAGYFDRKLLIRFPDGQIGEVQMWPPGMLEAKEERGGHRLYEEMRVLPDDSPRSIELKQQMRELYREVAARLPPSWKAVIGSGGD